MNLLSALKKNKILILILIISLILNVIGINWGLPSAWKSDTRVPAVMKMAKRMSPIPSSFSKPHFYTYLIASSMLPYFVYLKIKGVPLEPEYLNYHFPEFFTIIYLLSRLVTVLLSNITLIFIYLTGKEAYNKRVGLLSALLMALSGGFINLSHFSTVDIPVTFWITVALYFFVRTLKRKTAKEYVLCGSAIGLAISTKYQPGLIFLFFVCTYILINKNIKVILKNKKSDFWIFYRNSYCTNQL